MKAQMLKLAGVKTEKEFYKKFPTEEAFMKKYGHKLKKAQVGASLIPGLEGFGGVSTGVEKQNDGTYYSAIEDKTYRPDVAKAQMASDDYVASNDPNMKTYDPYAGLAEGVGTVLGDYMNFKGAMDYSKQLDVYGEVGDVLQKAASMPRQSTRSNILRPEYQMISPDQLVPALGTGTEYLAAKNGGKFSNGEIANTYAPGDLYQDLGYAEDEELKRADFGTLMGTVGKVAGKVPTGLAGAIGSKLGGGNFQASPESQFAGSLGRFAGGLTMIPGASEVGGLLAEGIAGAVFAPQVKERELNQNKIVTSGLGMAHRNFQQANSSVMEDGGHVSDFGYMSDTWNPQVITKFGDMDVSQVHTFAQEGMPQYRAGGHLTEYTPPSASAMYTGRDLPYQMEDGGKMAMGGDLQVDQGYIKTLAHNPQLENGGQIVEFKGPSHENGGMDTSYGNNRVNVEGNETGYVGDDGGFNVLGNMKISKFAAEQIGDLKFANMKYKKLGKQIGLNQDKQNKLITKSTEAIADLDENNAIDQLAINAHMLNRKAGEKKTVKNAAVLKMAGMVQNSILDTAEEYGLDPAALAEYKIKKVNKKDMYAEFGTKLKIARNGIKMDNGGNTSPADKFKEFEKAANARLLELLKKGEIKRKLRVVPNTHGVYNEQGGRDISSQAGIYKKGYSKTPVSLHNLDAARDYLIEEEVSPGYFRQVNLKNDAYANLLWPIAEKLGMYHVGDTDPNTKDTNWDPLHIGLVKEGKGTAYKELMEKYPTIFETPNAKKTVQWIIKNKNSDPEIKRHYDMLMAAQPPSIAKKIVNTVSEAIKNVAPTFDTTNWAAKAVGDFISVTNSLKEAMPTPDKIKAAINTPDLSGVLDIFDGDDEEEEEVVTATPTKAPVNKGKAATYKVRPKGEPRNPIVQTSPTSAVVKPGVSQEWNKFLNPKFTIPMDFRQKDSWADDGSRYWKPKLGIPTEFPNTKGSTSLLGKDYDPGYIEQPFWKPRLDVPYVANPAASERIPVNPVVTTAPVTTKTEKSKSKNKNKGKAATTVTTAQPTAQTAPKPGQAMVAGENALTDGSMPPQQQAQGTINQAMMNQIMPDANQKNALDLQSGNSGYVRSTDSTTGGGLRGAGDFGKFFDSLLSNAAPFLRPTNQLGLDPAQLSAEMLALSNNAVEPVFAQTYQPMLTQPTDVSYQDQLNEITSQSRAAERLTQGNPALQANIFAQSAAAKNKVLAEQFRANQAEKLRAYETNRQTLNDAQMKNLAILDQQYQRQSQAKSNTKAQTFAAINSISDKLAKNKLENKTLATYENMYNYRFTPQGVAYNVNGPQNFNVPTVGTGSNDVDSIIQNLDKQKEMIDAAKAKLTSTTKKTNGGIVKAIHSL